MSRVDTAMSRWLVYAQTHALLPLDLRVFPPILERLRAYLQVFLLFLFFFTASDSRGPMSYYVVSSVIHTRGQDP